ncbi:hypothetical protein Trco_008262 [Trichoderma cornu-damae]|uniref:EH domain-containing protein n=1 Tax=Trichoderma cornu-damae TaxID=654480 RepID=A0A9P8TSZ6_9HYPO|nr:hypothetical protein Trco_008262 [Trichoderma cornu-damae]
MKPADSAAAAVAIRGATLAFRRKDGFEQPLGQQQSGRDSGAYTAATEAVRSTAAAEQHAAGADARPVAARLERLGAKNPSLIAATLAAGPTAGAKTARRADSSASSGGTGTGGDEAGSGPPALISTLAGGAEDGVPATAKERRRGAAAGEATGRTKRSRAKTRRDPMGEMGPEAEPEPETEPGAPADDDGKIQRESSGRSAQIAGSTSISTADDSNLCFSRAAIVASGGPVARAQVPAQELTGAARIRAAPAPSPTPVSATPLSPVASPHLALGPSIQVALASPSPDPPKKSRSPAAKRPPTPPKPRGGDRGAAQHKGQHKDQPSAGRGRPHSHRLEAPATAATSRSAGQSASPAPGRHAESRPSSAVYLAGSRRHSVVSAPPSPSREPASRRRLTNGLPSQTQLDNLTDAIVAGSLASSRLTPHSTGPPSLAPPPPLPKRQKSPRLLHTLRQPHSLLPGDEEDQHRKGRRALLRKGKHAHHEGSRKKWREEIRPRERKRYEALWASNRGMLLTDTRVMSPATSISSDLDRDASQCVANVVVREVWRRSRLPADELAEIYDLVDRGRAGMLSRAEFVVGTWLVDQRLKGRKVPAKVTESVWGSANGVMVKGPNGR